MVIPQSAKRALVKSLAEKIMAWDEEILDDDDLESWIYGKYSQRRPYAGNEIYTRMAEAAVTVMEAAGEAQQFAVKYKFMVYD